VSQLECLLVVACCQSAIERCRLIADLASKEEQITGSTNYDQVDVCRRYGANVDVPDAMLKLGISACARRGEQPLNGLRHRPEHGTSGWFIWSGRELSTEEDFFQPLHIEHLQSQCPAVIPYLALPPGWRFLIAKGHEDVWFDENLLQTET